MYSISCIFVTACVVDFLSCVPFSISSSIHYRLFFGFCLFIFIASHKVGILEKMKCNLNYSLIIFH
jgi:phosphatidylglycerophosphatase A